MLSNYYRLIILFCVLIACSKNQESDINTLRQTIENRFNEQSGQFALAFIDLQDNQQIMINENQRFHAASTMKTPVMIEAFKQAKSASINLDDSILLHNQFKSIVDGSEYSMDISDDSDDDLYKQIGTRKTIRDLIHDMITKSSNLATNILIDLLDAKKVTQTMREMGADSILVLRGVEDIKAYRLGMNNTITALDLALIFKQLALGKALDEQSSKEMIRILMDQQHRDVIPLLLPDDVKVANKTGWITGLQHDSALIFLPDGRRYVLVLCAAEMNEFDEGKRLLAEISKLIYDYMMKKL
ncbi:MAG: serine hydrolase [Calditrichaeota bacterium]|nr:serine hydrolase [Calditrichota bacterium]